MISYEHELAGNYFPKFPTNEQLHKAVQQLFKKDQYSSLRVSYNKKSSDFEQVSLVTTARTIGSN